MSPQTPWPHGATVKLAWNGYGPYEQAAPGWAKRDAAGNLVSAYSLDPLDPEQWRVVEEYPTV